ncbi:MAG: sulfite exporter TauE/SafE family protein [Jatrophihabitans sp.]|nr:MAG: sulfite exporter TauE/SafE family protein [Jatrophihabitans sp.]
MNAWQAALVFVAGIGAGTINTVVGSGTLITFPVMIGVGIPPVTANVSNSVGLFPGSLVGAWGYRRELEGQRQRGTWLGIASIIGAVLGALLLLHLPASAFQAIVPALIILALLLVVFGKRLTARLTATGHEPSARTTPLLFGLTLASGIYGGYFGAAQGVILMGIFGILLAEPLQRQNGLKNLLAGLVNLVAAIVFTITAHVDWGAAGLVALGAMIGAIIGARVGRRLSPAALRAVIVVVGLAAVVKLLT